MADAIKNKFIQNQQSNKMDFSNSGAITYEVIENTKNILFQELEDIKKKS